MRRITEGLFGWWRVEGGSGRGVCVFVLRGLFFFRLAIHDDDAFEAGNEHILVPVLAHDCIFFYGVAWSLGDERMCLGSL